MLFRSSKNFPAALWADLAHTDHLIAAPGRITLVPSAPILEGQSCAIPSASLTYTDAAYVQPRPQRADLYPLGFVRTAADRLADRTAVKAALTPVSPGSAPRLGVLTALARALVQPALLPGVADIVGPRAVDAFLFAPRVGSVQNP